MKPLLEKFKKIKNEIGLQIYQFKILRCTEQRHNEYKIESWVRLYSLTELFRHCFHSFQNKSRSIKPWTEAGDFQRYAPALLEYVPAGHLLHVAELVAAVKAGHKAFFRGRLTRGGRRMLGCGY